ncbi:MAG: NADH-quinone oxidoreductase subunit NuoH [Chloroflexaceae bacterium]|jgi:NADH-quinone oxidoreductase subunit H|nr:NADH-quinone oxidoreductase subunit NuoH [Chloroflexaceae bacterium]
MYDIVEIVLNGWLGLNAPEWLLILLRHVLVAGVLFGVVTLQFFFLTIYERRAIARMQDRVGPNRAGPEGVFQTVADGIKMFTKEDIIPDAADRWVHLLAPCVVVVPTMLMFAVIPWGPGMVPVDMDVGLLFFFAVSSIAAVGLMMAGWASNNKFSLLGAMRAVAQMVSYEIPAVLSLLAIVMVVSTATGSGLSIVSIINHQAGLIISSQEVSSVPDLGLGWFVFTPVGFLAFICFFIASLAEAERPPFDIPEAESELVAGYMTEYSGMKFGLFYLAQFTLSFLLCAMTSIVFFGGWQGPGVSWLYNQGVTPLNPDGNAWMNVAAGVLGAFYFLLKTYIFFFVMVWLRGAFPRLRVDQLMSFGWKFLIPLTLVNVLSAAIWVMLTRWGAAQGAGFVEALGPANDSFARWGLAFVLTLAINAGAYYLLVRANAAPGMDEYVRVDDELEAVKA